MCRGGWLGPWRRYRANFLPAASPAPFDLVLSLPALPTSAWLTYPYNTGSPCKLQLSCHSWPWLVLGKSPGTSFQGHQSVIRGKGGMGACVTVIFGSRVLIVQ